MPDITLNIFADTDPSEHKELSNAGRVNCYVEPAAKDGSRGPSVKMCPGATEFVDTEAGGVRGQLEVDGVLYSVMDGAVFKIDSSGTKTNIGAIPGRGPVMMVRNQADPVQIGIINNQNRYYVIENDTISIVSLTGLPDFISVTSLNQRFIFAAANGQMFQTGLVDAKSIGGLDFATAEADPDGLVRTIAFNGKLYAMGERTTEVWGASDADTGFSFARIDSGYIKKGLSAKYSALEVDGTVYFIGSDTGKDHKVYRLKGYALETVSNAAVERQIASDTAISDIQAYSYTISGHAFYGLHGAGWTWELSLKTGLWHKRETYGRDQWRGRHIVSAFDKTLMGEDETGKIYEITSSSLTDGDQPILSEVRFEPADAAPSGVSIDWAQFEIATGYAGDYTSEPVIMFDWTKDGGATWSSERHLSLGKRGERAKRVKTHRLGEMREHGNWVGRLRLSEAHDLELSKAILSIS